jgi:hypothetical protein
LCSLFEWYSLIVEERIAGYNMDYRNYEEIFSDSLFGLIYNRKKAEPYAALDVAKQYH